MPPESRIHRFPEFADKVWRAAGEVHHSAPLPIRMIELTRLNGHPLYVNPDLIKFVEQAPDTVLTLTSGEKLVVRESPDQILHNIFRFRRRLADSLVTQEAATIAPENGSEPTAQDAIDPAQGAENG